MNRYRNFKEKQQQVVNSLPFAAAFNDEQLKKEMERLNVTSTSELVSLGMGCFCTKADYGNIVATIDKLNNELRAMMMCDINFAEEAFEYEMLNHEYGINWDGDWDVIGALSFGQELSDEGDYVAWLEECGYTREHIKVYRNVAERVMRMEW